MSLVALVIAILCGLVLIVEEDVGSLSGLQVAGIAIVALVIAGLAPVITSWPWKRE